MQDTLPLQMYEQIGYNVTDTVAKVIWAIAAGKSRIDEEGALSVILDSAVGAMARLFG